MTEFKPFDDGDWDAFCGCEAENPTIAYLSTEQHVVICDGNMVSVVFTEDGSERFKECASPTESIEIGKLLSAAIENLPEDNWRTLLDQIMDSNN